MSLLIHQICGLRHGRRPEHCEDSDSCCAGFAYSQLTRSPMVVSITLAKSQPVLSIDIAQGGRAIPV